MERDEAFKAYANELTQTGLTRMENIALCSGVDQRVQKHVATQIELAFKEGWHAALDAVRADYEASIPDMTRPGNVIHET